MRNRQIPKGLRDLLPDEVKVIRNMEKKAAQLFSSYAYEEVMTPTFEYLEVIEAGRGSRREDLFLFVDRETGVERYLRDARLLGIAGGAIEALFDQINMFKDNNMEFIKRQG
jgi:ATP phosphoribosyltransferase regulatory subunit